MRIFWTLVVLFAFATVGSAAGEADASQPARSNDSLTAAKREFDALKSASTTSDLKGGTGPVISMPEFHDADQPMPVLRTTTSEEEKKKKQQQRAANWLVDAMMNPKRDGAKQRGGEIDRLGGTDREHDDDLLGLNDADKNDPFVDAKDRTTSRDGADSKSDKHDESATRPASAFNPLSHYMAEWMTSRDYALLKANADRPPSSDLPQGGDLPAGAPSAGESSEFAAIAGLPTDSGVDSRAATAPLPAPAQNPFLANLSLPDSAPTVVPAPQPSVMPPVAPPAESTFTPSTAPESDQSALPDFVKPNDDEKYFKPLKRF